MLDDTIAAISTPLGEGGLAVVRVTGRDALAIADRCFRPRGKSSTSLGRALSHTVQFGEIIHQGRRVDEVLVAVLRAPRTFTREDTAEVSCHGGMLPARLVLEAMLASGARPAEPGEFTRRAFLNGRLDLAQAEAVADVIHSRTALALAAANEQLAGRLSERVNRLRDELLFALAHVEAHIDFPEEDIAPETGDQLLGRLDQTLREMDHLLATANEGQLLRRGLRAAIVGRPNAGKSSLFNQLLGRDRAIVSAIAGTTRDTIAETADVRGVPVIFLDTAGLRTTADGLEREGMRRSLAVLSQAELVLHVVDGSEPLNELDELQFRELVGRRRIVVVNKSDQSRQLQLPAALAPDAVAVSCLSGAGVESLRDRIKALVWRGELGAGGDEVAINARHQDALQRGRLALAQAQQALQDRLNLDLVAVDLRSAVHAVGEVVGKTATEDLLDTIFRQFCIGK